MVCGRFIIKHKYIELNELMIGKGENWRTDKKIFQLEQGNWERWSENVNTWWHRWYGLYPTAWTWRNIMVHQCQRLGKYSVLMTTNDNIKLNFISPPFLWHRTVKVKLSHDYIVYIYKRTLIIRFLWIKSWVFFLRLGKRPVWEA